MGCSIALDFLISGLFSGIVVVIVCLPIIGSFRKLGVPYVYNKDPTIWGTILGSLFSETPISRSLKGCLQKAQPCCCSHPWSQTCVHSYLSDLPFRRALLRQGEDPSTAKHFLMIPGVKHMLNTIEGDLLQALRGYAAFHDPRLRLLMREFPKIGDPNRP